MLGMRALYRRIKATRSLDSPFFSLSLSCYIRKNIIQSARGSVYIRGRVARGAAVEIVYHHLVPRPTCRNLLNLPLWLAAALLARAYNTWLAQHSVLMA